MKCKTMNLNRVMCLCSFLIFFLLLLFINSLVFFFFCYLFICELLFINNLFFFFLLLELAPKPTVGTDSILDLFER